MSFLVHSFCQCIWEIPTTSNFKFEKFCLTSSVKWFGEWAEGLLSIDICMIARWSYAIEWWALSDLNIFLVDELSWWHPRPLIWKTMSRTFDALSQWESTCFCASVSIIIFSSNFLNSVVSIGMKGSSNFWFLHLLVLRNEFNFFFPPFSGILVFLIR